MNATVIVKNTETGKTYDTGRCGEKIICQYIGRRSDFANWKNETIAISNAEYKKISFMLKSLDNWQDDPATPRQIAYLRSLGAETIPSDLTKGAASFAIDMAKRGELSSVSGFCDGGSITNLTERY